LTNAEGTSANSQSQIGISGSWGQVAAANLLAYYPLNETTGLVATDTANGRNGVLNAALDDSNWVSAKLGNGLLLEGTNDEFTVGSGNFNLANGSFTFSVWEKRANTGTEDYIFSQGTGTNNIGLHLGYRNTNVFTLAFWGNDLNSAALTGSGTWRHLVMTYDASTNLQSLYLNGSLISSRTASADYQGTGALYVGSRFGGDSTAYEGVLDEIMIFDRALTVEEVDILFLRDQ